MKKNKLKQTSVPIQPVIS